MPNILRRSLIGFMLAGAVALGGSSAFAQDADTHAIDLSNLVFYKGQAYAVTYEDSVSTKATDTAVVRKIGYGKTTFVNITTTTSGVYSSDAITSPHIRYPGVHVEQVPIGAVGTAAGGDNRRDPPSLAYWSDSDGWVATPFVTAGSFVSIVRTSAGTVVMSSDGTCVLTKTIAMC